MKISLIVNQTKTEAQSYMELALEKLKEYKAEVRVFLNKDYKREELLGSDFVLTLGGDGTILRTAGVLAGAEIPILGINAGHLGYLTEVREKERLLSALEAIASGQYYRDRRAMLYGQVFRDGELINDGLALNEVLLSRRKGISILRFRVYCAGQEMSEYSADGMIIATPTGSTAYNLSAGGPIISPTAPVYVMTPICSHSFYGRAVIMDDDKELEILIESPDQLVAFDGENMTALETGDMLRIRRAKEETTLVKLHRGSFLEILRDKMSGVKSK